MKTDPKNDTYVFLNLAPNLDIPDLIRPDSIFTSDSRYIEIMVVEKKKISLTGTMIPKVTKRRYNLLKRNK